MNYLELIWRLIEIALQKESSQEIDEDKDKILNAKKQDETE